jgi:nitrogenase molybdenum-cofactor synthesis protein NifE
MKTVLCGSQTGGPEDYRQLASMCDPGTVIVDDMGARELARFLGETPCDLFIGGVKERPLAYKLGVAFCDHNHECKHGLAGFSGTLTFGKEVEASVCSPVWDLCRRKAVS